MNIIQRKTRGLAAILAALLLTVPQMAPAQDRYDARDQHTGAYQSSYYREHDRRYESDRGYAYGQPRVDQRNPGDHSGYYRNDFGAEDYRAYNYDRGDRYSELVQRIRAAIPERAEIPNGYIFRLDSKAVTLPETAEWIAMERLCCPFLTLQLSAAGNQEDWTLTLSGPEGVKVLIAEEFPAR